MIAEQTEARFEYSSNLPQILAHARCSLLVSTYQSRKVFVIGTHAGKLDVSFLNYEQPMGIAVGPSIAIGDRSQVHFLSPQYDVIRADPNLGIRFDGCFVPAVSNHTGRILSHDLAWGSEGLWVVNTLFSCLCTLDSSSSFVPRWKPKFISDLADEDRCHLNGMAIDEGIPRFVTALSETNSAAGWRPNKAQSGCVIDVSSGETICRGLSMPHSPRVNHGALWVLNSGIGGFGTIDITDGTYRNVESVPGFTRGLAIHGQFAFVGLSKIRESNVFGGLEIAERHKELCCGVAVIDLITGRSVAKFQFLSAVEEIFAVEVVPDKLNPLLAGAEIDSEQREIWIVPTSASEVSTSLSRGTKAASPKPERSTQSLSQVVERSMSQSGREANHAAADTASKQPKLTAAEWVDIGNAFQDRADQASAIAAYRQALAVSPDCIPARQNLGYLLMNMGCTEEAIAEYETLLTLAPTPMNRLLRALAFPVIYDSTEQIQEYRSRAERLLQSMIDDGIKIDTTNTMIPTTFLLAYQGLNDRPFMELLAQIITGPNMIEQLSSTVHGSGSSETADDSRSTMNRKIRIGFMSAYFRDHTIGRLNYPTIRDLDRSRFEVVVLYAGSTTDSMAKDFQRVADHWVALPREIAQARTIVTEQQLDVLIFADVGMDALTSSLAWSRMAPVQCVTWGHPDTTGSPHIDYFLSSELLDSEDAQDHYTEKLIRLPGLGIYYDLPTLGKDPKQRADFGLSETDRIYACPQSLFKFHPDFDTFLDEILTRDPNGILIVLEGRNPEWTRRLQQRWRRTLGERCKQVRWLPMMPREDYIALLSCSDVMLDPIHFGGGNSILEAMAVGTPVVALKGKFLRSRIANAIDFVTTSTKPCKDREQYVVECLTCKRTATSCDEKRSSRTLTFQDTVKDPRYTVSLQSFIEEQVRLEKRDGQTEASLLVQYR